MPLSLCMDRRRIAAPCRFWEGRLGSARLLLAKTGVGPRRSADALSALIRQQPVSSILLVGYGGALASDLSVGDLAVIESARMLHSGSPPGIAGEDTRCEPASALADSSRLFQAGLDAGLAIRKAGALTAPGIIGRPADKALLHRRYGADIVDMETAALSRIAGKAGVPIRCIRVVSDTADDDFLAPFSYDPSIGYRDRARQIWTAGGWIHRYNSWRQRSACARKNLRAMLEACLDLLCREG